MAENSNNLLDPTVCRGEDFLPNILESLGVSKQITRNQSVMGKLSDDFGTFLAIDLREIAFKPSETDIETVRSAIQEKCLIGELGNRTDHSLNGESDICIDTSVYESSTIDVRLPGGKSRTLENARGEKVTYTNLGEYEHYSANEKDGLFMSTDERTEASVKTENGDIITSPPTESHKTKEWNNEGLIMKEHSTHSEPVWTANGQFDVLHKDEFKSRNETKPFGYECESFNYNDGHGGPRNVRRNVSYNIADLDRSSSELMPERGTEEFADEMDMMNWYKEQDKETLWKKISEKAIAIVNLARRVHSSLGFNTIILSDIKKYCDNEKKVGLGDLEGIYGQQQGKSQDIINQIKNTAEQEEVREQEGEEH